MVITPYLLKGNIVQNSGHCGKAELYPPPKGGENKRKLMNQSSYAFLTPSINLEGKMFRKLVTISHFNPPAE
jgi:hypothetical protein